MVELPFLFLCLRYLIQVNLSFSTPLSRPFVLLLSNVFEDLRPKPPGTYDPSKLRLYKLLTEHNKNLPLHRLLLTNRNWYTFHDKNIFIYQFIVITVLQDRLSNSHENLQKDTLSFGNGLGKRGKEGRGILRREVHA